MEFCFYQQLVTIHSILPHGGLGTRSPRVLCTGTRRAGGILLIQHCLCTTRYFVATSSCFYHAGVIARSLCYDILSKTFPFCNIFSEQRT